MSYVSKRTIVSIITGIVLIAAYIFYALGEKAPAPGELRDWALVLLVFIGISVGAQIVIQILFHIAFAIGITVKEGEERGAGFERVFKAESVEDERDKLIELKTSRIGYIIAGAGAIVMLFCLAFGGSSVAALHILFGSFAIGGLAEGIARIRYESKGV